VICHKSSIRCHSDYCAVLYLAKAFQFRVRVFVCVLVCAISIDVLFHILFHVRVPVHVNLITALRVFMSDMAIILSIPKAPTRRHRNLQGLQHERAWVNSAENLGASPFQTNLSTDTNFSHMYLAGESL
jgi:hypothetical protein